MNKGLLIICALFLFGSVEAQVPCSFDNNQDDPNQGYLLFFEGVTAYIYVDPSIDNPGCSSTGDFVLTSLEWPIANAGWFNNPNPANGSGTFQFGVYELVDTANPCAGVGDNIWLSSEYTQVVQDSEDITEYFIPTGAIPLDEPFFITWKILEWNGSMNQVLSPVWDGIIRPNCRQFYSGNDGMSFLSHEDFFNSNFGWIDVTVNGFYEITEFAEVQFIHASGDAAAVTVDLRVNGEFPDPSFDNLEFKCATNTVLIPAGSNNITINAPNSTDDSDPIATFSGNYSDGDNLIGVVHGIASETGYTPGNGVVPLSIDYIDPAQSAAEEDGETDLVFFHAVTDVSQVDVQIVSGPTIANGIDYGSGSSYVGIDTDDEQIVVNETGIGPIQDYYLSLDSLDLTNLASVVVALGFENPGANNNGEPFGLWMSNPQGGCLEELNFINFLTEGSGLDEVLVFPNPTENLLFIENAAENGFRSVRIYSGLGELVGDVDLSLVSNRLDMSNLAEGMYMLVFQNQDGENLGFSRVSLRR
ncbi:MAG: T9SS type A sorting domain-containing protein [Bacteroidota bacterium]